MWPRGLVDRIVERDYLLFVGSGVSASARNRAGAAPPTWTLLLKELLKQFLGSGKESRAVASLIRAGDYLSAAEHIAYFCEQKSMTADFRDAIAKATDGPTGDKFQGGPLHNAISLLDPRTIVTTNFDCVLERHFVHGYLVKGYEDRDVAASIRQGDPVLLKLHGTADAPTRTILTRLDFARLRRDGSHALETLQALLLTRTALFVGYSLSDPDLRLLLENIFGAQGQAAGHYLLSSTKMSASDQQTLRSVYGVQPLLFSANSTAVGTEASLMDLVNRLVGSREPGL
jgi:hypothetical protein